MQIIPAALLHYKKATKNKKKNVTTAEKQYSYLPFSATAFYNDGLDRAMATGRDCEETWNSLTELSLHSHSPSPPQQRRASDSMHRLPDRPGLPICVRDSSNQGDTSQDLCDAVVNLIVTGLFSVIDLRWELSRRL